MTRNSVFRWPTGRGWLILSGGNDSSSAVRAQAINHIDADGNVVYIAFGQDYPAAEQALSDMESLGAPSGYLLDVLAEDDETLRLRLAEASMIVLVDGVAIDAYAIRSGLMGAAHMGMQQAFGQGAVILAEGEAAQVFGQWSLNPERKLVSALEWLENTIVVTGTDSVAEAPGVRTTLYDQPEAVALGIAVGSALAFGPNGELQPWGEQKINVALGRAYQS
jgi:hypothetical protein